MRRGHVDRRFQSEARRPLDCFVCLPFLSSFSVSASASPVISATSHSFYSGLAVILQPRIWSFLEFVDPLDTHSLCEEVVRTTPGIIRIQFLLRISAICFYTPALSPIRIPSGHIPSFLVSKELQSDPSG